MIDEITREGILGATTDLPIYCSLVNQNVSGRRRKIMRRKMDADFSLQVSFFVSENATASIDPYHIHGMLILSQQRLKRSP